MDPRLHLPVRIRQHDPFRHRGRAAQVLDSDRCLLDKPLAGNPQEARDAGPAHQQQQQDDGDRTDFDGVGEPLPRRHSSTPKCTTMVPVGLPLRMICLREEGGTPFKTIEAASHSWSMCATAGDAFNSTNASNGPSLPRLIAKDWRAVPMAPGSA
ncbi:MAG: hypothetical protein EOP37_22330 [Rubrivivax sp.]|nr:MAG: hypothetical protein EOP37_22330 [Rubrivivax sp.]